MLLDDVEALMERELSHDEARLFAQMASVGRPAEDIAEILKIVVEQQEDADEDLPVERYTPTVDGGAGRFG